MAQKYTDDPAVALRFRVSIDQVKDIGWWNSLEGLGMETAIEQREEGGNNNWIHQLPTRLKFSNVKLSRPINADSAKVATWFMDVAKEAKRTATARIEAVDGDGKVIAHWSLLGVVPVRWTGPSFKVDQVAVATETIELAYHGFYDAATAG